MDRTRRAECVMCDKCLKKAPRVPGSLPEGWGCPVFAQGNAYKPRILCAECQRAVLNYIDHFD